MKGVDAVEGADSSKKVGITGHSEGVTNTIHHFFKKILDFLEFSSTY